ncbi:MAG: succinylglutamate desuccinylase/aspartoacylase family protein, partial [Lachnospiraceae bacterium]|nr:succinylglutamate desuccinylase/aspartoacylase family protein [Lachnospiraceae bacterium]
MHKEEIYRVHFPYREDMVIQGFRFGKGDPTACILGAIRGNEIQQMYICSQLIRELKELEMNGCINAGKSILVIPVINGIGLNIGRRFFGVEDVDINRDFPGRNDGDTTDRIAFEIFDRVKEYTYGIQLTSFYMTGEFVPHVRMMETGYQNTSLANLFGLPYVVVRKPSPLDTKTLNYNWQDEMTAAFSLYTNRNDTIDDENARQALSAVLRFLTRMGIIRYESHSGFISHVLMEDDLTDVYVGKGGIFRGLVKPGEYVRYGYPIAEIRDPYEG